MSKKEAIEFGDSSFEGHYFFNKGNILAKDSTVITIKVENAQPISLIASPGTVPVRLSGALVVGRTNNNVFRRMRDKIEDFFFPDRRIRQPGSDGVYQGRDIVGNNYGQVIQSIDGSGQEGYVDSSYSPAISGPTAPEAITVPGQSYAGGDGTLSTSSAGSVGDGSGLGSSSSGGSDGGSSSGTSSGDSGGGSGSSSSSGDSGGSGSGSGSSSSSSDSGGFDGSSDGDSSSDWSSEGSSEWDSSSGDGSLSGGFSGGSGESSDIGTLSDASTSSASSSSGSSSEEVSNSYISDATISEKSSSSSTISSDISTDSISDAAGITSTSNITTSSSSSTFTSTSNPGEYSTSTGDSINESDGAPDASASSAAASSASKASSDASGGGFLISGEPINTSSIDEEDSRLALENKRTYTSEIDRFKLSNGTTKDSILLDIKTDENRTNEAYKRKKEDSKISYKKFLVDNAVMGATYFMVLIVLFVVLFFSVKFTESAIKHNIVKSKGDILDIPVKKIMSRRSITVNENARLIDLISTMDRKGLNSVYFVKKKRKNTMEIISKKAILDAIFCVKIKEIEEYEKALSSLKVKDIMDISSVRIAPNTYVYKAAAIMANEMATHAPIVSHDKIIGTITQTGILKYLFSKKLIRRLLSEKNLPALTSVMKKKIRIVTPDTYIKDAVSVMRSSNVNCVLVLEDDILAGIFTQNDFLHDSVINPQILCKGIVRKVMSKPVFTISSDKTIIDAVSYMVQKGHHHLVVVNGEEIIGILNQTDLFRVLSPFYKDLFQKS